MLSTCTLPYRSFSTKNISICHAFGININIERFEFKYRNIDSDSDVTDL